MKKGTEMKKKQAAILIAAGIIAAAAICVRVQNTHTFTVREGDDTQIQPLYGKVKVRAGCDTDVVFTDTETGEEYVIGYITGGVTESISLERDSWYTVKACGDLEIGPVNLRIE